MSRAHLVPPATRTPRKPVHQETPAQQALNPYAQLAVSPELTAARALNAAGVARGLEGRFDLPALIAVLREQAAAAQRHDLQQAEAMLMNQAVVLERLFTTLTEQGMAAAEVTQREAFLRLALRCQSQCRATLEALANLLNPPCVIGRQTNVTTGPQQINNGGVAPVLGETQYAPNELSGGEHELRADAGTAGPAGRTDTEVETVGAVHRAPVRRR